VVFWDEARLSAWEFHEWDDEWRWYGEEKGFDDEVGVDDHAFAMYHGRIRQQGNRLCMMPEGWWTWNSLSRFLGYVS
jgi:hypothetical protein